MSAPTRAAARAVVVVAALAFTASCGGDDDPTATTTATTGDTTTTTQQTDGGALSQECPFEESGWAVNVRYPGDWVANDETETDTGTVPACRIFDADDAEPPRAHELNEFGVLLGVDEVDFADARSGQPLDAEVLEEEELTVDGRPAVRREDQLTESGIRGLEGARVTTYVVDLDGAVLVARTHEVGDLDYERNREVLDAMMGGIDLEPA